jgi:hypothetical protein
MSVFKDVLKLTALFKILVTLFSLCLLALYAFVVWAGFGCFALGFAWMFSL